MQDDAASRDGADAAAQHGAGAQRDGAAEREAAVARDAAEEASAFSHPAVAPDASAA